MKPKYRIVNNCHQFRIQKLVKKFNIFKFQVEEKWVFVHLPKKKLLQKDIFQTAKLQKTIELLQKLEDEASGLYDDWFETKLDKGKK